MREHKQLLLANKAWASELKDEDPEFFARQTAGEFPNFLWIGCSDSRVSPEQITQVSPGGMFIHRNIANLVEPEDLNLMSVLQFAVDALEVKHIIVCGHYGCGGLKAALEHSTDGAMDAWLERARRVYQNHIHEIDGSDGEEARVNRYVEVNVRDQLVDLAHTQTVAAAFARGQDLTLHGWVYDIRDGFLKPLMEIDATTVLADVPAPDRVLV